MEATAYPEVNALVGELLEAIRGVLGARLVGVYLYGSAVAGSFDAGVSDVDLLAATAGEVDEGELGRLRRMHEGFARDHPGWEDRIEVAYVSVGGLRTFKEGRSWIGIVSPGEPLHRIEVGRDWLMNWYLVREGGRTLFGPPPGEVIAPVTKAEFVASIREHGRAWGGWTARLGGRRSQSYAVLTMCRALYTVRFGEHVAKGEAAAWAQGELPEWAGLIRAALAWRVAAEDGAGEGTRGEVVRFVGVVRGRIRGD